MNKALKQLIQFLLCISIIINREAFAVGTTSNLISMVPHWKTYNDIQDDYFKFITNLLKHTAFWAKKQKDKNEAFTEIYFKYSEDELVRYVNFFNSYRHVLLALNKYPELHIKKKLKLIPQGIYDFTRERFAINSPKVEMNPDILLVKMIGGNFNYGNGKTPSVIGLIRYLKEFDINNWSPIKRFIRNFEKTLAENSSLSQQVGHTLLPLAKHYYQYMDNISKLRIFKEIAADNKELNLMGKKRNDDLDVLAIKIFQSSGPVLIKLLQQLQEEVVGESPMTKVLAGLKKSKPLDPKKAALRTKKEIKRVTGRFEAKKFKFRYKPLGIASIAQTHLFEYKGQEYVVKVLRDQIENIFQREKNFLQELVSSELVFDKGMKQKIANTNKGIYEELNFNNERRNMDWGVKTYTSEEDNIISVYNPKILKPQQGRGDPKILIMSKAAGEPLGDVMERNDPFEIKLAYKAIQKLYRRFIKVALSSTLNISGNDKIVNFYHGDLHRENIFLDVDTGQITLIDYGNAGVLDPFMRDSIQNIFAYTEKTGARKERVQDQAIIDLAKILESFILKYNRSRNRTSATAVSLIKTYFRVCFNPFEKIPERTYENKKLYEMKYKLENDHFALLAKQEINSTTVKQKDIDHLSDDIDFIKALMNNCLKGATNPLLATLASKSLVSIKLNLVFRELLKNGIAMPKEVIFFNKSKALLEGILLNLSESLEQMKEEYEFVDPDQIYRSVIKELHNVRNKKNNRIPMKKIERFHQEG